MTCDWTDEHDGTEVEALETTEFAIGGHEYAIDQCAAHANRTTQGFAGLIAHARPLGRTRPGRALGRPRTAQGRQASQTVRAWANANGFKVSPRGRIPARVVEQYQRAGGAPLSPPATGTGNGAKRPKTGTRK